METKIIFLLIPVLLIQLSLVVIALRDILKKGKTTYLDKTIWIVLILFISLFGPAAYLLLEGKEDNEHD